MSSIFSKIAAKEIPSYKVAENNDFYAFLDINPLSEGHCLVIPKQEVNYIFDLEDELYQDLFLFAKRVSEAIMKVIPCKRVGVAVIGLEVPHAHIHLIPIKEEGDMDFKKTKLKLTKERFHEIANEISSKFI